MATITVFDETGATAGTIDLPAHLFDVTTNVPLLHQVVTAQLAAARQGTHKTKNRGEVSGSGRKPFKQKGTGRSRQGSVRAPEHRGGGIVHGPQPRSYAQRTPKKMIVAALLGALSDRARGERIHAVTAFGTEQSAKTREAGVLVAKVAPGVRILVVVGRSEEYSRRAVRNLAQVHVLLADQLNAYDVLRADDIVFTKDALEGFIASRTSDGENAKANATTDGVIA